MSFDWSLHIGDVIQVLAILGTAMWAYHGIAVKLALLAQIIEEHSDTLREHGQRLTRYEESLFKLVGDLQRMVGHLEGSKPR